MPSLTPCHFNHDRDRAGGLQEQTLAFIDRYALPATPINYAVAYDYVSRHNADLVRELDIALEHSGEVDAKILGDLFETYFLTESADNLDEHLAGIHQVLAQVLRGVEQGNRDAGEFRAVLASRMAELQENASAESVTRVAEALAAATNRAIGSNQRLRDHLERVQQEATELREELKKAWEEAVVDGLTGLFNRRELARRMNRLVETSGESATPLSFVMLDIDHFKRFNDNFGHLIGDEVIRRVAATVKQNVRGTDVAARYGGEEFAVVLPETDLPGAITVAANIHKAVSQLSLVLRSTKQRLPAVTVSAGVAVLQDGEEPDALIDRADQALYEAKHLGRNRVVSEVQLPLDAVAADG